MKDLGRWVFMKINYEIEMCRGEIIIMMDCLKTSMFKCQEILPEAKGLDHYYIEQAIPNYKALLEKFHAILDNNIECIKIR